MSELVQIAALPVEVEINDELTLILSPYNNRDYQLLIDWSKPKALSKLYKELEISDWHEKKELRNSLTEEELLNMAGEALVSLEGVLYQIWLAVRRNQNITEDELALLPQEKIIECANTLTDLLALHAGQSKNAPKVKEKKQAGNK